MRNDRINYVLVGVFVILMLAGTVGSIAVLQGRTGATDAYWTRYGDATGLKFGTRVLYMGYPVGQVEKIVPVVEDGEVRFNVRMALSESFRAWPVPRDSVARIKAGGLLAAMTIDIRAGSAAERLAPGDFLEGREHADVFSRLSMVAEGLQTLTETSVRPLLDNLNRSVSTVSAALERDAGPLLDNLTRITGHFADDAPQIVASFLLTADEISRTSQSLRAILGPESAVKVGDALDNVREASAHIAALAADARAQLAAILGPELAERVGRASLSIVDASDEALGLTRDVRRRMDAVLSEDNVARVGTTLARLEAASGDVRAAAGRLHEQLAVVLGDANVAQVEGALGDVRRSAAELAGLMEDLRRQSGALLGPGTVARVDGALDNVTRASADIAALSRQVGASLGDVLTPQTGARLRATLDDFAGAARNVATLTADLGATRATLDRLLGALERVVSENDPDLRRSVTHVRYSLGILAQHVDAVLQNLEDTTRNMNEFSRQIRANPGILLRGTQPSGDAITPAGG